MSGLTIEMADAFGRYVMDLAAAKKKAEEIKENIEDLEPEYSLLIDENYWDLI